MSSHNGRLTVVNRLCEFFIAATHAILYMHHIYPQRIFEMRQKYGVATFYSKHPVVNDYIANVVASLHTWFLQDHVESVTIPILHGETVQARYVFHTSVLVPSDVTEVDLGEMENQFRAHLCRLLSGTATEHPGRDRAFAEPQSETSFDFIVHTKGVRTDDQWMPADGHERRQFPSPAVAHPIKDADIGAATVQLTSRVELASE